MSNIADSWIENTKDKPQTSLTESLALSFLLNIWIVTERNIYSTEFNYTVKEILIRAQRTHSFGNFKKYLVKAFGKTKETNRKVIQFTNGLLSIVKNKSQLPITPIN